MAAALQQLFGLVAATASALFFGASAFITFVSVPAYLDNGSAAALAAWRSTYRRGAPYQVGMIAVSVVAALGAALAGGGLRYVAAAAPIAACVPYTLRLMFPTNKQLMDKDLDGSSTRFRQLILQWNNLCLVRILLSGLSFGAFVILQ
eukprot:SM000086S23054  [mRNA]  locus=s86:348099:349480:- [translate_table: standard]